MTSQKFIFKIHSSRLRKAKWSLKLTIGEAKASKELIAVNDSQLIRFIDEINGMDVCSLESRISDLQVKIKHQKSQKDLAVSRPEIKKLYAELDACQFQKDYVCVVIDKKADYVKLYKDGFQINKITYRRLLGTTGGVKSSTIVFVNEKLLPELNRRIDNGRNPDKPFVPAKLEAYRSLVCSSSVPVSWPEGIVVVRDCITHFPADVIELDDTYSDRPCMKFVRNKEITLNESDGYGLAMPGLMERWGQEIGAGFSLPGCVIRNAFCKGAVFPVDFRKFAKDNGFSEITDIWGNTCPIDRVELVLTESMLKLWDSYSSIENYLTNCKKNHYTFAITKYSEEKLEHVRNMNYQFLQSYDFTDDQIEELIAPTVKEIRDILGDDYRKTILYAKGTGLNENKIGRLDASFATALMIEPEMKNDPYVAGRIRSMIQKRINDAKIGVLKVPANYSLVSGDPYSLCQSMFGMEVTGLLKAGQVYSRYWTDHGVSEIASFRAPMTSHNNIRRLKVVHSRQMDEFYRYMTTPTIFNSWDTCADAMNGMDKDGDCVINTSFPLLVENTKDLPAIQCVQRKAPKCIPTPEDLMQSNIDSFGNAIGEVTNKITSMFEVQARFPKDSREYRLLGYRIKCGQLYQQNSIDKTKGILAKNMPAQWYKQGNDVSETDSSKEKKERWIDNLIAADKKPYFMKYIYPSEKSGYEDYNRKNNEKCLMRFRITLEELLQKENRSEEEQTFLDFYQKHLPLGTAPCMVNRICWKVEEIFDGADLPKASDFDYSILKCDAEYPKSLHTKIKKIYENYKRELQTYMQIAKLERVKQEDRQMQKYLLREQFRQLCLTQCPNEEILCNIVLDLCYGASRQSKQFAWDICGGQIIRNLLKRNDSKISYPVLDENGDIEFEGQRFRMETTRISDPEII
ncbi:MAG: hypothetical protein HFG80_10060 [Eubacterium sp.]|nr:hypothetical protein [Eubacterium sp.]